MAHNTLESLLGRRIALAHLPTPVQEAPKLSQELGIRLRIKRDDLTESIASGNKIRKLEYLAAEALQQGADTLVSYGGIQSNHCRAVAWVAAKLGFSCVLALRGQTPSESEGNLLLDRILGADVRFFPREVFQDWPLLDRRLMNELRAAGKRPYSIPIGGSNATGTLGYIAMVNELIESDIQADHIYCALGSGGTYAGLLIGSRYARYRVCVHGIAVCDDVPYLVRELESIRREFHEKYGVSVDISDCQDGMDDQYIGRGYAINTDAELRELIRIARTEALVLDPVYSLKAFIGMIDHVRQGRIRPGETVLFIHTGGHAGLFPKHGEMEPLL